MGAMKIAKWGNSLAIRLPADLARELDVGEGDFVDRDVLALRRAVPKMNREEALARMRETRMPLPVKYKFDREEANARSLT